MNIEKLNFTEKVELLKELITDLDITLVAAYGAEGYILSQAVEVLDNEKIYIYTDICTG